MNQRQVRVASSPTRRSGQGVETVAFFDEDGNPVDIGGGGGPVAIGDVTGLQSALDNLQSQIDNLSNGDN